MLYTSDIVVYVIRFTLAYVLYKNHFKKILGGEGGGGGGLGGAGTF